MFTCFKTSKIAPVAALMAAVVFTGCAKSASPTESQNSADNNVVIPITSESGLKIADIRSRGDVLLVPGNGIFYSQTKNNSESTIEYHLLRYDDKVTDTNFGTVTNESYEAMYSRTVVNNKLYTLAITGDILDNIPDPQWLMEFDLESGKMEEYKLTDNGFPYSYMTAMDDKILILEHDQQDKLIDHIVEFDTSSKSITEIMNFELTKDLTGETIRGMYSDFGNLYVLRIFFGGDGRLAACIDVFDKEYQKTGEFDITDILTTAMKECLAEQDVKGELQQMVSSFKVLDNGVFYYENFSSTRIFGNMITGEVLYGLNDLFSSSKDVRSANFYTLFDEPLSEEIEGNSIYSFNDGKLNKISGNKIPLTLNEGQSIWSVSSADDNILVLIYNAADKTYEATVIKSSN